MNALLLLVLCAAPSGTPVDAAAAPSVLQREYALGARAIVQVGEDPFAAGTVLSESGIIVTGSTGLAGKSTVGVTFTNSFRGHADVIAVDDALGIALLHARDLPAMAYVPLSPLPSQSTQAAYAFGLLSALSPQARFARIETTSVSRAGKIDDRFFTARFGLDPRARGGPVLSFNGQLIGLVLAGDKSGVGFAINARQLLAFISAHASALPATTLVIQSDPSGAAVLVDGNPQGATPATIGGISAGEHLLTLRSPGLPDVLRRVVTLGPSRLELASTILPGAPLTLDAPPSASIYVDGLLRLNGPGTLWLPGGSHTIQATMPGRRPSSRTIEVVEDRPLAMSVELVEAKATLSLDSVPSGAEVMLDDNRVGATPLTQAKVTPGTYELALVHPGFHTLKQAVSIPDGLDVNLGKLGLEAPHGTLVVHAPPQTEIALDGGPRHLVKASEPFAPGQHRAQLFAPYQFATSVAFHGADGETVQLSPVFVAAGSPSGREVAHTISSVVEGGAGVFSLVSVGFFLAAESDREGSGTGSLTQSGHSEVSVGLITGGVALGLYAASAFIEALQPTPEMGWSQTASGQALPSAGH